MTLSTQTPRVVITGNGTRGPFSLVDENSQVIRLTSTSHLRLTRYDTASDDNDDGTVLLLNTDYTVGGTQDARTFTLDASQDVLSSTQRIVAERVQSYSQDLSLTTGGAFNASAVQSRFDKVEEKLQEIKAQLDRKVGIQFADTTANKALPAPPAVRPNYFYQNADGSIGQSEIPDLDDLNTVLAQVQAGGIFETDRVNVRNYYIDGQSDWTAAIVAAAAEAMSTGKAMWFPADDTAYVTDCQNFASSINIILDPGATVQLKASATLDSTALYVFRLRASNSSIVGGKFDFNRDNQGRAAFNTAGGSNVRNYWGVVALGTLATHIENVRIETKVINCADYGVAVQYVDNYDLDVDVETSGSGVLIKDCDGGICRRARLSELDNADWEVFPHAFDVYNSDGGQINNIEIINQSGYDTSAGNSLSDWFTGITIADCANLSGSDWYVCAKNDSTMTKSVGVSMLGLTDSAFSNITIRRYTSVNWEIGALDNCVFTNVFGDGEYLTTSLFAGEAQMGCHVVNQGLYSNLTSRIKRPVINCTFTNVQMTRMLSRGLLVYLGVDCQWIGGKFNGNQYGIDVRSDNVNGSFLTPETQVTARLKFVGVEAKFNEIAGMWNGGSTDLDCEACDFSNNGQAANAVGDALRLGGTLGVATSGYYGNNSATTVPRLRPRLADCIFQDDQTVTTAFGSADPGAPTIVSVERPELYSYGQTITINNGATGPADLIAQVRDINGDELTISTAMTNFPLVSGTGTISTSGTTVTGTGTAFTTQITGRMWIKNGSNYRRVIAVTSNTSATLESAFPSNLSGASFDIVKTEVEQMRSQDYGLYTLSIANDSGLTVINPRFGAQNKIANMSLVGVKNIPDIVNALEYGVKGDGATDDTAALEAACAAAIGRTLLIPPGINCLVNSTVDFDDANTRIIAYGARISQGASWSGADIISIGAANITLEGLTVEGTSDGVTGGITTVTNAAAGTTIRNCDISDVHYGISANNNSDILIENNNIHDCSAYTVRCHNIAAASAYKNITVRNNVLDTSHLDPATTTQICLLVRGDSAYPTTNVKVTGNRMVMPTNPTNSGALGCEMRFIDGGVFSDNYGKDGAMTVSVAGSTDVSVIGNNCEGQTFYAIEIASVSSISNRDIVVSGNTIDGNSILNYGIGVQGTGGSSRLTIADNTIKSTALYGIFISNQWDWITITGNSIDMAVAASQYGIYCFASTGAIDQMAISGNLLNGNATALKAIYIDDCSNVAITGNVIMDWVENPVFISSDTATVDYITITGNIIRGSGNITKTGAGSFGTRIQVFNNPDTRFSSAVGTNWIDWNASIGEAWGTGDPEGAITAGIGSTFVRTNGGLSTTLYVKESGTGNTGWSPANGLMRTFTAANIADATNGVNTSNKRAGVLVWDSTNNRAMRAAGSATTSLWYVVDGSASVTPV